jgi:hypothetical protein
VGPGIEPRELGPAAIHGRTDESGGGIVRGAEYAGISSNGAFAGAPKPYGLIGDGEKLGGGGAFACCFNEAGIGSKSAASVGCGIFGWRALGEGAADRGGGGTTGESRRAVRGRGDFGASAAICRTSANNVAASELKSDTDEREGRWDGACSARGRSRRVRSGGELVTTSGSSSTMTVRTANVVTLSGLDTGGFEIDGLDEAGFESGA